MLSTKKNVYFNDDLYKMVVHNAKAMKKDFTIHVSGSTQSIYLPHSDKKYFSLGNGFVAGSFLSSMVKKDILLTDYPMRAKDYQEQYFNLDNIERNIGKSVISIDIVDCYWRTAYNLGYISRKTYMKGRENPKGWKIARVSAIGGLSKRTICRQYKEGVLFRSEILETDIKLQWARHNIIGYVHDMFNRLFLELGDGYLCFLTDCVFVEAKFKSYVEKFLKEYSYNFKTKVVGIDKLDRFAGVFYWTDFEGNKERIESINELELKEELTNKEKDILKELKDKLDYKYYQYTESQTVWITD